MKSRKSGKAEKLGGKFSQRIKLTTQFIRKTLANIPSTKNNLRRFC